MSELTYFYSTTGQVVTSTAVQITASLYSSIGAANLARVEIGSNVTSFFNTPFSDCANLTSLVFLGTSKCSSFGISAFIRCYNLNNVVLPDSIGFIGENSFRSCTSLQNIVLSSSLVSMTNSLFFSCTALRSIVIPSSIKTFSTTIFRNCNNLKTIVFENPQTITSMDQTTFGGSTTGNPPIPGPATIVFYNTANAGALPSFMRPVTGGVIWPTTSTFIYNSEPMKPTFVFSDGTSAYFNGTVINAASYTSLIPVGQTLTNVYIGEQVTEISDNAFDGQTSLATVDFPTVSSILTIGNSAFKGCSALSSITLPSNVPTFGTNMFMNCSNLVDCDLPTNLTTIPQDTFNGCSKLRTIVFPTTIITIKTNAFTNCTTLNNITFPTLITTIEAEAFMGCSSINSIILPNSITTIGINVFKSCTSLSYCGLSFNQLCQIIPEGLFDGCSILPNIVIPGQITTIGSNAFNNCSLLNNYIFENQINLVTISSTAFTNGIASGLVIKYYKTANASGLSVAAAGITWPSTPTIQYSSGPLDTIFYYTNTTTNAVTLSYSSATTISSSSYSVLSGTRLTAAYIGQGVTTISGSTFLNTSLEIITFSLLSTLTTIGAATGNGAFENTIISNIQFPETVTYLGIFTFTGCSRLTTINLPTNPSFTSIPTYCFTLSGLINITIPSNITSIGNSAFQQSRISSIIFPNSVTSIGSSCLANCTYLTSCTLPTNTSFTYIPENLFNQSPALYSIIIPKFVTSIGPNAFFSCRYLSTIIFSNQAGLTSVNSTSFSSASVFSPITVRYYNTASSANLSVTTQNIIWNATIVPLYYSGPLETTFNYSNSSIDYIFDTTITSALYSSSKTLTGTTIGSTVTTISNDTFLGKSSLTSVSFSSSPTITYIGNNVFKNCTGITSITIPNTVTSLGTAIFQGCSNLNSCILSINLSSIPTNTFNNCSSLNMIEIPPNITNIAINSFLNCSRLAIVVFYNASSTNNKLNSVSADSGFSTINSLGSPSYPSVYYYNAADSTALTTATQNIVWPTSTEITYNGGASCFAEGTKILCLNEKFEEEYIPIEKLRKGDLVKSYLHGYRKVDLIGKGYSVSDMNKFTDCMYKLVKTETNGLIDDLIITGGHSILVDDLGDYTEKTKEIWNEHQKIDDKYLLLAGISRDFEKLESVSSFYYYQFILENNGDNEERFGIWANGILVETSTKKHFLTHPYILLR
jgi:hypothetical protein